MLFLTLNFFFIHFSLDRQQQKKKSHTSGRRIRENTHTRRPRQTMSYKRKTLQSSGSFIAKSKRKLNNYYEHLKIHIQETRYTADQLKIFEEIEQGHDKIPEYQDFWLYARQGISGTSVSTVLGYGPGRVSTFVEKCCGYLSDSDYTSKQRIYEKFGIYSLENVFALAKNYKNAPFVAPKDYSTSEGNMKYLLHGKKYEPVAAYIFFELTGFFTKQVGIIINNDLPQLKVSCDPIILPPEHVPNAVYHECPHKREDPHPDCSKPSGYYYAGIRLNTPPKPCTTEIKCTSNLLEGISVQYYCQVMAEMFVTKSQVAYLINLVVDEDEEKRKKRGIWMRIFEIPFDEKFWQKEAVPCIREVADAINKGDINRVFPFEGRKLVTPMFEFEDVSIPENLFIKALSFDSSSPSNAHS